MSARRNTITNKKRITEERRETTKARQLSLTGFRCFIGYLKRNESKVRRPAASELYEGGDSCLSTI